MVGKILEVEAAFQSQLFYLSTNFCFVKHHEILEPRLISERFVTGNFRNYADLLSRKRRTCSSHIFLAFGGCCLLAVNSVRVGLFKQQPRGGDSKCPKEFCLEFPDKKPATPFRKPCQVISRSATSEAWLLVRQCIPMKTACQNHDGQGRPSLLTRGHRPTALAA